MVNSVCFLNTYQHLQFPWVVVASFLIKKGDIALVQPLKIVLYGHFLRIEFFRLMKPGLNKFH